MVNVVLVQFRGIRAVARACDRSPAAHPRVAHSPLIAGRTPRNNVAKFTL